MDEKLSTLNSLDRGINDVTETNFGWIDIDRTKLSYGGQLYPASWKFQIKPALIKEIRHYSSLDETNPFSVSSAIYDMVLTNLRIVDTISSRIIKSDKIFEHDQLYFLLEIHLHTGNTKSINIDHECSNCQHKNVIKLTSNVLRYNVLPDKTYAYIDAESGVMNISTKSYGVLTYSPVTLRDSQKLKDFINETRKANRQYDVNFAKLYSFLRKSDTASIKDLYAEYVRLSKEQYGFMLSLQNKMLDIRALNEISEVCEQCESGIRTTIRFDNGLANIFFNDDIDSELL